MKCPQTAGIVLAGGSSRRMGQDKRNLRLNGQTLLERSIRALEPIVDEVLIVGADPGLNLGESVRAVPDHVPGFGPLAGLATGLATISADHAIVLGCDHPFLNPALLAWLASQISSFDAVVPVVGCRRQTLHAVYARSALAPAQALLTQGNRKFEALLIHLQVRFVAEAEMNSFDPSFLSFLNVNTPAEWEAAQNRA